MINQEWKDLKNDPPIGTDTVILYHPSMRSDKDFPGHCIIISNPDYARINGIKNGYTLWTSAPELPDI